MQVEIRLADSPLRRWHLELVDRLASLPHVEAIVTSSPGADVRRNRPGGIEAVFAVERLLHGRVQGLSAPVAPVPSGDRSRTPDVLLDLGAAPADDPAAWRLEFDGQPGEAAALAALRQGRPPLVRVVRHDRTVVVAGRPGSESPGVLVAAFDDLLAGCVTLLVKAVSSSPAADPPPVPAEESAVPSLARHAAGQLAGAVAHRGYRALYRAPHWRVGWRYVDGPSVIDAPSTAAGGWRVLPDDGRRFYADPFPLVHDEQLFLFVEDYEHRVGQGVISVVRFDEDGPSTTPTPVLRHRVHLSYPFVFEHDGEIWMIPETSAAGTIELYRAIRFPARWSLETTLVSGVEASDSTVFRHRDRWWMLGTVRSGGSFSDSLHIWHAEQITGPWTAHPHNPVLVDISSARPAGRVEDRDGRLLRPVQDGRSGYGAALGLAEITELDEQHFDQQVLSRLTPGPWWPGRRLHTLNRAGRLECIDGSAMSPRFWSRHGTGGR
ncbi:hypothetical protein GCM10009616_01210 [Microlunatus lacustris]